MNYTEYALIVPASQGTANNCPLVTISTSDFTHSASCQPLFQDDKIHPFSVSIAALHDEADPQLVIYLFLFPVSLSTFSAFLSGPFLVIATASWNFQCYFYQGKFFRIHLILKKEILATTLRSLLWSLFILPDASLQLAL